MADNQVNVVLKVQSDIAEAMKGIKTIQDSLGKIKMPKGLGESFEKSFGNLDTLIKKFNDQLNKGIKTKGDVTGLERITNQIDNELDKIGGSLKKLTGQELRFKVDTDEIKKAQKAFEDAIKARDKYAASQADVKIGDSGKSANDILDQIIGKANAKGKTKTGEAATAAKQALNIGDIAEYQKQMAIVEKYFSRLKAGKEDLFKDMSPGKGFELLRSLVTDSSEKMKVLNQDVTNTKNNLNTVTAKSMADVDKQVAALITDFEKETTAIKGATDAQKQLANQSQSLNQNISQLESHVAMYFSFAAILRKVTQIARKAFQTVKELDAAMVETAVVTNFDVGDMWEMLPTYTKNANELGSTIKDVYEAATLYYQQGLNTAQAMGLANETLKMARIGGLQAAEATDMMTAALRGFNMQINELSAQRINDVYSKLAAITASDTRELGSAMERTASIANSAGMAFETTSAFLAQMIETTREAPENLGTAMKTIVARFQEMKEDPTKLIDSEGEMLDANRVDKALKTIGVSLMDTNGQFRNLDDVFLEISQRWDGLSQTQQRYIATIAAGSRQQSRFIAMMQNYERVTELVEAANNANGASQEQFNKTLEGLDAKLNKLKNAWDQFAMGLANNKIIKFAVDGMTELLTVINKIFGVLDNIPDPFGGITKSIVTLLAVVKGMSVAGTALTGGVKGIGGWARGDRDFGTGGPFGAMMTGVNRQFAEAKTARQDAALSREAARKEGLAAARAYQQGFASGTTTSAGPSNSAKVLINKLYPPGAISKEARQKAYEITTQIQQSVQKGGWTNQFGLTKLKIGLAAEGLDTKAINTSSKGLQALMGDTINTQSAFIGLGNSVANAGATLSNFGMLMGGPVGGVLTSVGFALTMVGNTLSGIVAKTKTATIATFGYIAGLELEEIQAKKTAVANGELTLAEAIRSMYAKAGGIKGIFQNIGETAKNLGSKVIRFLTNPVGLAITLLSVLGVVAYRQFTELNREMKKAGSAAGAAADAYSSAAQATTELRDNLAQLEEAQNGFDGLVEGTAAFNEQLIKSNELILGLLKKYPMLYDYLTTESNGRMTISDEGMDAVLEYQKQITSQAAALNTVMNGEYQALKSEREAQVLRRNYSERAGAALRGDQDYIQNYEKEQEFLDKQAETYRQTSKATAITTALSGKELQNQEAITQLYSSQYDTRKKSVDLSKREARQVYADFYGYDLRGKKFYDNEGNEVTVDKKDMMAAAENIEVLTTFEADAESLNNTIDYANDYFENNFNWNPFDGITVEGRDTVISDLLSKNISVNEDVIQSLLNDTTALQKTAAQLSAEQIASIMGVSLDTVASDLEGYREKVVDLLENNANDIAKAQAENYGDLGILIGKARGTENTKIIQGYLKELKQDQRQTLLSAGQALQDAAGEESMKTLVNSMLTIYKTGTEEQIKEVEDTLNNTNWDSAIERMSAFKTWAEEGADGVNTMGNALLDCSDSANLLTDSFEEVYDSTDFQEAYKDIDKLTDSMGHIDAAGIEELSESSATLNKYMEAGIMTTGGMAKTLNFLHDNGDLTFLDLNDDVLTLLNNLGELDTALGKAHNIIENFDPGLDTGEAEDFFAESIEKYNDFYENGEWGNPQMRAYAELIVGAEQFNTALKKNNGDLRATYQQFNDIINKFAEGSRDAWVELANRTDEAASIFSWGENGQIDIKLKDIKSVEDLTKAIVDATGYSEEAATLMVEQYLNYSPDAAATFEALAFTESFNQNGAGYMEERKTEDGRYVISQSDLNKFVLAYGAEVGDEKAEKEIKQYLANAAGVEKSAIDILDTTKEGLTAADKAAEYSEKLYGKNADQDQWIQGNKEIDKKTGAEKGIDVDEAIKDARKYFTESEAMDMAWEAFKNSNEDFYYNGELLDREEIGNDRAKWDEAVAEITDGEHWVKVGEAIAEGFYNYEHKDDTTPNSNESNESNGTSNSTETSTSDNSKENLAAGPFDRGKGGDPATAIDEYKQLIRTIELAKVTADEFNKSTGNIDLNKPQEAIDKYNQIKNILTKMPKGDGNPLLDASKNKGATDALNRWKELLDKIKDYKAEPKVEFDLGKAQENGEKYKEALEKTINNGPVEVQVLAKADKAREQVGQFWKELSEFQATIPIDAEDRTQQTQNWIRNYIATHPGTMSILGQDQASPVANQIAQNISNLNPTMTITIMAKAEKGVKKALKDAGYDIDSGPISGSGGGTNQIPTITSNPQNNPGDGSGSGGGGGGGNSSKPTINNFSIQEIIRYDAEKRLTTYQNKLDKLEETLEKNLEKIGVTVKDISGNTKAQKNNINKQIDDQKIVSRTYRKQLKRLDKGGYREYLSWTDSTGETHDGSAYNLSKYIYRDKNGNYQIDTGKIKAKAQAKTSNKSDERAYEEMLYKAVSGALDPLVSGLEESEKKIDELKKKRAELDQQTYEAFYAWENELTKIYNLNQRIEKYSSVVERASSQVELTLARAGAGAISSTKAINQMHAALQKENSAIKNRILQTQNLVKAEKQALTRAVSDSDEKAELARARKSGNQEWISQTKQQLKAANLTDKYTTVKYNKDGTASIDVDWKSLEKARNSGKISETTYEAIKDRIDDMIEHNQSLEEAMKSETDLLTEVYNQLDEYRKTIVEMEDTLLKQLEEDTKKQIANMKSLSSAITKALKDILDEVRRRLKERRQAEDNAKTENDIFQKQQRLNLLRASTAGGNRVEIAQLEKEIAEAQQSYQRTLEDQLLDKLQQQGDEAARQRERQIEIAEAQLEASKSSNARLVNTWLSNPTKYKSQIKKLWKEANGYDEKGVYGQAQLNDMFNAEFAEFVEAQKQLNPNYSSSLEKQRQLLEDRLGKIITNQNTLIGLDKAKNTAQAAYNKVGTKNKSGKTNTAQGQADKTYKQLKKTNTASQSASVMKEVGFTTEEIRKAGASLITQIKAGNISTVAGAKSAGYNARHAYSTGKFKWSDIQEVYGANAKRVMTNTVRDRVAATYAKKKGNWTKAKLQEVFGENQSKEIIEQSKDSSIIKKYQKAWASNYNYANMKKRNFYKYQTGGLADYTGPAWLDGTPNKPELVLNAADTQNFIQLKDILSSALRSGALETSAVTVGDTNFEVNINVDHIANDYDVDRIAARVKKEIVESSSYRNVTSVRKFR